MSIRAEWRLRELLGVGDADPFDSVVLSTGLSVDLTGSREDVLAGLARTLELESRLFARGITCDLKDAGQDCLTCAMYVADRAEEQRAPLCRLGRDQRLIEDRAEVLNLERRAPLVEIAARLEHAMELGQLDPEYEELLTAAGL